ncbi:MAG: hypothetical protein UY23_C0004G0053 [Candidatus Jorgensenbacteria bacterium GW2011_GWA1_48_11]|uniref:Uncharacterized protein n=1 Tax=Candidatus Jorgensenbacteria bacterium GW2011_GWA1_48_11 TaxID=1618660 RepID=A0A0G1WLC1_9BACT|nr:MAG: hypothetical protein UY23_C0004G0053 [Candidatus Jorgensenbacteria bacterium GW2011_GWA1_48_11]KKW11766.1 MAG: hypothetical protein UY51_C0005G0007 [Candidatus Jorgensenbacteria bacterium GW2011_GWB1_49_9]
MAGVLFCAGYGNPAPKQALRYAPFRAERKLNACLVTGQVELRLVTWSRRNFAKSVRVGGIEPPLQPWEGRVIPLDHTRNIYKS